MWLKTESQTDILKVVPEGFHGQFFGVKVKAVQLIGERRFLVARSGLNERTYPTV